MYQEYTIPNLLLWEAIPRHTSDKAVQNKIESKQTTSELTKNLKVEVAAACLLWTPTAFQLPKLQIVHGVTDLNKQDARFVQRFVECLCILHDPMTYATTCESDSIDKLAGFVKTINSMSRSL